MSGPAATDNESSLHRQLRDPHSEFAGQCAALAARLDRSALPAINLAMHPDAFDRLDDVSDRSCFNDRFIEPQMQVAGSILGQIGGGTIVLGTLSFLVVFPIFEDDFHWLHMFGAVPFLLFGLTFIFLAGSSEGSRIRFNRQAQLVHLYDGEVLINFSWREVYPVVALGDDYQLHLMFPTPYEQLQNRDEKVIRSAYRFGYAVCGEFSWRDHLFMGNTLERLEFIRRYMEDGINSVQADEEHIRRGLAEKPLGRDTYTVPGKSGRRSYRPTSEPFEMMFHWLCGGPLIDRWLEYKASKFRWPEEVHRLCAPGADLSAYDTRPVKSKTSMYYRYEGMDKGIVFVDREGHRLH